MEIPCIFRLSHVATVPYFDPAAVDGRIGVEQTAIHLKSRFPGGTCSEVW